MPILGRRLRAQGRRWDTVPANTSAGFVASAAVRVDFLSLCFPSMFFTEQIICKEPLRCRGDGWKTNYNFPRLRNGTGATGPNHRVERCSLCPQTFIYFILFLPGYKEGWT